MMIKCKITFVIRIKRFSPTGQVHQATLLSELFSLVDEWYSGCVPANWSLLIIRSIASPYITYALDQQR
jgi:hypothetical protein